jgi:hypothetical protein
MATINGEVNAICEISNWLDKTNERRIDNIMHVLLNSATDEEILEALHSLRLIVEYLPLSAKAVAEIKENYGKL